MGIPAADLLLDHYTAAANVCDESVTEGGATEKRYTCGVMVPDDAEYRVAIDAFRTAMAGDVVEKAGSFGVIAGASYSSVMTITDDDMRADAPSSFSRRLPRSELYNAVSVTWANPAIRYESDGLTPLTNSSYETEDNSERIVRNVDLGMVNKPYQARRIGQIVLEQSRMQATHVGVYPAKFSALEPGDWVTRVFNRDGLGTVTMKVVSIREVEPEWYEITLRQAAAANFVAPTGTIPTTVVTPLTPGELLPGTPGTPVLTESVSIDKDGKAVSSITATWSSTQNADRYVVGVKQGANEVTYGAGDALYYAFASIVGLTYQVRVRAVDKNNTKSAWSSYATITPTGDLIPPSAPSALTATGLFSSIMLTWTNPTDLDFAGTEIWEATSNNFASATRRATVTGTIWSRDGLAPNSTRYYWIRAVDRTGNVSAKFPTSDTAGIVGTTLALASTDFPADLKPIEIVNALPTTGNYQGRTVFLKTDNKTYRYDGTAFISDTVTDITTTQITDGAITTPKLAANAVTADKLEANSVTAGKIAAGAIAADQIQANAITASKLTLVDTSNLIVDSMITDVNAWTLGAQWTISTDAVAVATTALNTTPVFKVAGTGAVGTATSALTVPATEYISVLPSGSYYFQLTVQVETGFNGQLVLVADLYAGDKTTLVSAAAGVTIATVDYRTAPASARAELTMSGTLLPASIPATSQWLRFRVRAVWPTSSASASAAYFAGPTIVRMANANLIVDGAVTAQKINVSSLSAITADVGTLTSGLIRSGASGMELDLVNNRIRSGGFSADELTGFQLDGASGTLTANSVTIAGGTSSKRPFEFAFGAVQDGILSDEGTANVYIEAVNGVLINVSGTVRRTPTETVYNLEASLKADLTSGTGVGNPPPVASGFIKGGYPRAYGIACAPASALVFSGQDGGSGKYYNGYLTITSAGDIYQNLVGQGGSSDVLLNQALIGRLYSTPDADPLFLGTYASTTIHVWSGYALTGGIRRIRVPDTVTVSGTATPVVGMRVWMWGAAGHWGSGRQGGPGGHVRFDHTVTRGEMLSLLVGGHNGDGWGGCSPNYVSGSGQRASSSLSGQGGGGSFLWRGPTLRTNLLGVAGGGGGGGRLRNGGCGGSATFAGGNGTSGTTMTRCLGITSLGPSTSNNGSASGGGGYIGGGRLGTGNPDNEGGRGGTNYVISTATTVTNTAAAEDTNGAATTVTPPGTGQSTYVYAVGVANAVEGQAGPGLIAIQWLT